MFQHAIVYLDHHHARVFQLDGTQQGGLKLTEATQRETDQRHRGDGKRPSHEGFFHAVAAT